MCDTSSIYSGVGQLLINSAGLSSRPKLFLVLPNQSNINKLKNILDKISIDVISYNNSLKLDNFSSALKDL